LFAERVHDGGGGPVADVGCGRGRITAHLCQLGLDAFGIRRNRRSGELAFYRCFSPRPVPLSELVRVAGRRWTVEETFQAGKRLAGLDEHQVRRWISRHRWVTLAMLAHAFLTVTAATEHRDQPAPAELIPLTVNEIQHLFTALINPIHDLAYRLRWSQWRRRHQARARASHYRRQAAQP
jgi:Transposase DDE domain